MWDARGLSALIALAALGCGESDEQPAVPDPVGPQGCVAGEETLPDGSCEPAGIPPDACAAGFEPDGVRGCNAVLPTEPCAEGQMALPGATACAEVMACGGGTWGDIPTDGLTQFVDVAYTGGASDGSQTHPWLTIGQGIDAAAPGATVAVAAGSYAEAVNIGLKPVKLWGRCPALVEVVATGSQVGAIMVADQVDGTEIHGLAIRGNADGVLMSGSENLWLDRLWIHDVTGRGIDAEAPLGWTSVRVQDTLIERAGMVSIYAGGAYVEVEGVEVRDGTQPGVHAQTSPVDGFPAELVMRRSVVTGGREYGVGAFAAAVTVTESVIRDGSQFASNPMGNSGVIAQSDPGVRSVLTLTDAIVERNGGIGVFLVGADGTIERTVVRDTWPLPNGYDGHEGRGIVAQVSTTAGERTSLVLRRSVAERNHEGGVLVLGSDALIEGSIVRDTLGRPSDGRMGIGIMIQRPFTYTAAPATATVRTSVVERNRDVGLGVTGAEALVETTLVRDTLPRDLDGGFGDGMAAALEWIGPNEMYPARLDLWNVEVASSARAGVASFSAQVGMGQSKVGCNVINLAGELIEDQPWAFEDLGGNDCSCGEAAAVCKVLTSGLAPPEMLP